MKYIARDGKARILSVYADSEDEARAEIERQLSKPGRYQVLKAWREGGRIVTTE